MSKRHLPRWLTLFSSLIALMFVLMMPRAARADVLELVGFCDMRGATDIAPIQVIPLDDSAIDGVDGACIAPELRGYVAIEGRGVPAIPDASAYDVTSLPHVSTLIPRRLESDEISWFATSSGPRSGWPRSLDHPPR